MFVPGLAKPGGFTITSTPRDAEQHSSRDGYVELAVQESPKNPPAAWLWRPSAEILGASLRIRVGGSFVWPPPGMHAEELKRLVLVAGGVGIKYAARRVVREPVLTSHSPLISIFAHIYNQPALQPEHIRVLYTSRGAAQTVDEILFYPRVRKLMAARPSPHRTLELYLTGPGDASHVGETHGSLVEEVSVRSRRISHDDLVSALGPVEGRKGVVAYVCGPARMTDEFVGVLQGGDGMTADRVLCEKWW